MAWDWRIEEIEIQPGYLRASLGLLPEVPPAKAVHKLRETLASQILESFPEHLEDLPSGRYWARGYMLNAGKPPPEREIRAFITATRRTQGLS